MGGGELVDRVGIWKKKGFGGGGDQVMEERIGSNMGSKQSLERRERLQGLQSTDWSIAPCCQSSYRTSTSNSIWISLPVDKLDESAPFGTSDQLKIIEDISSHGDMNNYMARWDNSLWLRYLRLEIVRHGDWCWNHH